MLLALPAAILAIQFSSELHTGDLGDLVTAGLGVYILAGLVLLRYVFRQIQRLERAALTDSLCGLPNRRALHLNVNRDVV
ncbi:MAG: hypothetical protein ACK442_02185, partial [Novosphingobium sp.]